MKTKKPLNSFYLLRVGRKTSEILTNQNAVIYPQRIFPTLSAPRQFKHKTSNHNLVSLIFIQYKRSGQVRFQTGLWCLLNNIKSLTSCSSFIPSSQIPVSTLTELPDTKLYRIARADTVLDAKSMCDRWVKFITRL